MDDNIKYSGLFEYINSLNAAIRENQKEMELNGCNPPESFHLSNDTISMFGTSSLFNDNNMQKEVDPSSMVKIDQDMEEASDLSSNNIRTFLNCNTSK